MTDAALSRSAVAVNPSLLAAVVVVPTFMEVLDTTIAIVALRYIAGGRSATVDGGEMAVNGFSPATLLPTP
jgi:MFS transporter, DHA2 family, multidrug resistance protein